MHDAAQMISAGFSVESEPFLQSMLLCLRAHLLHVSLPVYPCCI